VTGQDDMIGFAREVLSLPGSVDLYVTPLAGRGSDRAFHRITWEGGNSVILIHYEAKRPENACYADIATFLEGIGVPAPRVFGHDPYKCLMAMEDLGEADLWSLRKAPWEVRKTLYRKTLAAINRLHTFPEKDFPLRTVRIMEDFTPDLYQWERDYFRDRFVRDVCGIDLTGSFAQELEAELSSLAERLIAGPRALVHRDFQSQNVMIRDGEPFLIDFQGMRFGSPFYDLASLLYDPYVDFSGAERDELLAFCHELSGWNLGRDAFLNYFREASVQRLMQALGAYGFLGLTKGLTSFLGHIPAGLRNLSLAASGIPSSVCLGELCRLCRQAWDRNG
jgi:aminoglycoside/choline kinase family phosphotransferase